MTRQEATISTKQDRETLATILFRNGYTVRTVTEKINGKTVTKVEYWREA